MQVPWPLQLLSQLALTDATKANTRATGTIISMVDLVDLLQSWAGQFESCARAVSAYGNIFI
jgi:hypothetical protein